MFANKGERHVLTCTGIFMVYSSVLALRATDSRWPNLDGWRSQHTVRANFATPQSAANVLFNVVHQDLCPDSRVEVCAVLTWSCFDSGGELHNQVAAWRPPSITHRYVPRWYFLDIEGERESVRFEMHDTTTMTPTVRLTPFRNYTAAVYSVHQERVTLLKNFTFSTISGAPSSVRQLNVDVLTWNVPHLPRARKLNVSWFAPQEPGAREISGYLVGLYKKPDPNRRIFQYKNVTIMEVETNHTWQVLEPVTFYEKRLFIRVVPYNRLHNKSNVYGLETVADVLLKSQYSRELSVNSVGGQSVDIEIDQAIFKDIIEAGLVTNLSVFVSPVDQLEPFSWRATDYTKAVYEDKLKRKQIRAVFQVSPLGWNLATALDRRRPDYARFPCFEGGHRNRVVCSIGVDQQCDLHLYSQICNGPLVVNTNYTVFVRAHLKRSNYLPAYDDSKPLPVGLHTVADRWNAADELQRQQQQQMLLAIGRRRPMSHYPAGPYFNPNEPIIVDDGDGIGAIDGRHTRLGDYLGSSYTHTSQYDLPIGPQRNRVAVPETLPIDTKPGASSRRRLDAEFGYADVEDAKDNLGAGAAGSTDGTLQHSHQRYRGGAGTSSGTGTGPRRDDVDVRANQSGKTVSGRGIRPYRRHGDQPPQNRGRNNSNRTNGEHDKIYDRHFGSTSHIPETP